MIAAALLPQTVDAQSVRAGIQHVTATELPSGEVAGLTEVVHRIGVDYAAHRPRDLWPVVAAHRQRAFTFLHERRHTLREGRGLARQAGMLSVILAWVAHDLGRGDLVPALCDDAWEHGRQAGAPDVCGWAEDVRATEALYDDRPLDALTSAIRGLAVAPPASDAAVRLSTQMARAYARLGDRYRYEEATARTSRHRESLPVVVPGLFSTDASRLVSFEASSRLWLGDHAAARATAAEAIALYAAAPRNAPTRLAIAKLDLAFAHAELGEPEEAIEAARHRFADSQPVHAVRGRLRRLDRRLTARYPRLTVVRAFHEETRVRQG